MKKTIIFLFLFIVTKTNFAQTKFAILVGGGTTWYYGDMNDRLLTHEKLFSSYYNLGLQYQLSNKFVLEAGYINGKIRGADSLAIQEFNIKRNLNFTSKIWELYIRANYHLNKKENKNRKVSPYLFAGIGYFHFDPTTTYNGNEYHLHELGTEGQFISGGSYPKPYKLYQLAVPLGIGVEFKISNSFKARVELSNHYCFTDYLDDVSSKYADSTKLSQTPNGTLVVELASNLNRNYPNEGFGRGNPKNNDTFMLFGAAIIYKPNFLSKSSNYNSRNKGGTGARKAGRKKKKNNCDAFK